MLVYQFYQRVGVPQMGGSPIAGWFGTILLKADSLTQPFRVWLWGVGVILLRKHSLDSATWGMVWGGEVIQLTFITLTRADWWLGWGAGSPYAQEDFTSADVRHLILPKWAKPTYIITRTSAIQGLIWGGVAILHGSFAWLKTFTNKTLGAPASL